MKVLLVVSTWSPMMIADMHRARMMCRHLRDCGWEPEVLAPDFSHQLPQCIEPDAEKFFDGRTPFYPVEPRGGWFWDALKSSSISWRGLWPVLAEGNRVLSCGGYDLVFFSTTHYMLTLAGYFWQRKFGIPFVVDLHDPWHARLIPRPKLGRGIRGKIWSGLTAWGERVSLASASAVVSVSPAYLEAIGRRYGAEAFSWQRQGRGHVEPFGYESVEVAAAGENAAAGGRPATIAYCGAGGRVMRAAWVALCQALTELKAEDADIAEKVRFVFKGTSLHYRPGDSLEMVERAHEYGVADLVSEDPSRLSYAESLRLIATAEAALLLGVNDPGYMASKLFPYLASGKPLLAVIRHGSVMRPVLDRMEGVTVLEFDEHGRMIGGSIADLAAFLREAAAGRTFDRKERLTNHTAAAMTQRLAALFDRVTKNPAVR